MQKRKDGALKNSLHPRNKNRENYDLEALVLLKPELTDCLQNNSYGTTTINFSNPVAVKLLNQALLHKYYGLKKWNFPNQNLCPPIPGRADYLHYLADLLAENNKGSIPYGSQITGLDIGVGASCIYPILGVAEYQWDFIGTDIDPASISSAEKIVRDNQKLEGKINIRLQKNPQQIFAGILNTEDKVDFTICNPPFHSSMEEALKGSRRKIKNLTGKRNKAIKLNFSGNHNELVTKGGEIRFIETMINESLSFSTNVFWFTTLISKQSNLRKIELLLEKAKVKDFKVIPIGTGNKKSRIMAWTYLSKNDQKIWQSKRWNSVTIS
ncbi:23S rRNA (adenine(1618)-N(6))-methyltransferase RlmF [Eudoraea chungangensis]|uniref:23S rRNA (adenine(1618)-N(6))-methyltransferase RlmF n=1 Tax=Eudoraea chungangensis TaxID=1481905 RepID=UPI0023EB7A81|nr:23S rRNA (adenine(1618)-N(6))-methyltransferase RlmF [Eudoraea chungangensis]